MQNNCACVTYDPVGLRRESSAGKSRAYSNTFQMKNQSQKGGVFLSIFYMTLRVFPFRDTLSIFVKLCFVVLITGILFILLTLYVNSCFTSCTFAARTLDFAVKFRFVFRYEAVVLRRYVLPLLSASLLQKFQAYLVYLSLI